MKNCVYRFIDKNEEIIYIGKAKEALLKKLIESKRLQ